MQITKIREDTDHTSLDPVYQEYLHAKTAADRANDNLKVAQQRLLDTMAFNHVKTYSHTQDGLKMTFTYVKRETVNIDEKGLRRKLTAKVYDKYTVKKLDRKAMEDAMQKGDVNPMDVAPFVSTEESKPYLKYTIKDVNDDE